MCFYYDEMPVMTNSKSVKTRKVHRCEGCNQIIPKGSIVNNYTGLFDHAWYSSYICEDCQRKIYSIAAEELEHGCSWNESWCSPSDLREYLSERSKPLNILNGSLEDCYQYVNSLYKKGLSTDQSLTEMRLP